MFECCQSQMMVQVTFHASTCAPIQAQAISKARPRKGRYEGVGGRTLLLQIKINLDKLAVATGRGVPYCPQAVPVTISRQTSEEVEVRRQRVLREVSEKGVIILVLRFT